MDIGVGLTVMQRVRLSARDAHHANGACDGAKLLELFADVASELLARLDGDEGRMRSYEGVELIAPVRVGDVLEVTGVITAVAAKTRSIAFEARKVVSHLGHAEVPTAVDALAEPVVVARAIGTSSVPPERQRKPRLVLPALAPHPMARGVASLPEAHAIITPAPHYIVTPANTELVLTASVLALAGAEGPAHLPRRARDVAAEATRCRDAGAAIVLIRVLGEAAAAIDLLAGSIAAVRRETDLLVQVAMGGASGEDTKERARRLEHGVDVASLDCGTWNQGDLVQGMPRPVIRELLGHIVKSGAATSLECHEVGHVHEAIAIAAEGLLRGPPRFQLVVGAPGAIGATDDVVRFMASQLPVPSVWGVASMAAQQRAMTELVMRLGGHARVGPEGEDDARSPLYEGGTAALVRRAAEYARGIGREIVEPGRARTLLRART